jgi:cyclohexyl-isocyanide hydratase
MHGLFGDSAMMLPDQFDRWPRAFTELPPLVGATHDKDPRREGWQRHHSRWRHFGYRCWARKGRRDLPALQSRGAILLDIGYDPDPPFDAGHPDRAPEDVKALLSNRYEKARTAFRAGIEQSSVL